MFVQDYTFTEKCDKHILHYCCYYTLVINNNIMLFNQFTIGVLLIGIAYYFGLKSSSTSPSTAPANLPSGETSSDESMMLVGWQKQIQKPARKIRRVAMGLNVDADLIVSGTSLLKLLNTKPGNPTDHHVLVSVDDLQRAFLYYFEQGAAVERYFSNANAFHQIIEHANKLEDKKYYIGGNAALMAQKMAESDPDVKILFIGPVGPRVKDMFHPSISVADKCLRDKDEVHLIMEYARGEKWGDVEAPVATRLITSNDVANSKLEMLEEFASSAIDFKPDVIAFSGLHLLEGVTPEVRMARIAELQKQVNLLPQGVPVHLELASMADVGLMQQLATQVFPMFHSIGLNEQELVFLSKTNNGPHPDLKPIDGYPEIGAVTDILYWMLTSIREGQSSDRSRTNKLSRVHFHSLTFHIIATRANTWQNSMSAVGAGARVGGMQACNATTLDPEKVELRIPKAFARSVNYPLLRREILIFDPTTPVSAWRQGDVVFHFSPVLVCKVPLVTVGLGDAISATGLLYSQYLAKEMPW